jgi:adenine-specific DNA-methyltransferase
MLKTPKHIPTQGIKYAGAKTKLIPQILKLAKTVDACSVLDAFSGSTRVSQAFAKAGYTVCCNDISDVSKVLGQTYLLSSQHREYYKDLIKHLNNLKPYDGWFTENYGGVYNNGYSIQADGLKRPWQLHNTRKLDAIRDEIDALRLPEQDKAVALTSLILALDKVDNTLGHFVSYLKEWSPRSSNELILRVPEYQVFKDMSHKVTKKDVYQAVKDNYYDLAYLDPPYGSNNEKMPPSRVRYSSYYHLWTTICLNDKPELFGKSKRRLDTSDKIALSVFEEYKKNKEGNYIALEALAKLIESTNSQYLILSYSSGGRATAKELNDLLQDNGKLLQVVSVAHAKNVMSSMKWTNDWVSESQEPHKEFLFLLQKCSN